MTQIKNVAINFNYLGYRRLELVENVRLKKINWIL